MGNTLSPEFETKEKLKQAVAREPVSSNNSVELNEAARQIAEQLSDETISPAIVQGIVRIADFFCIAALGIVLFVMNEWSGTGSIAWSFVAWPFLAAALLVAVMQGLDGYQIKSLAKLRLASSKSILALGITTALAATTGAILYGSADFPLSQFLAFLVVGATVLCGARLFTKFIVSDLLKQGRLERRAVVVGGGKPADEIIRSLESDPDSDIRICGIFDDRSDDRSPENIAGYPKLGTVSELLAFARTARINMLIVTLPLTAEKRLLQMLKRLWVLPVDIRLSAHSDKLQFRQRNAELEGHVPLLDIFDRPIADWDAIAKRTFDIVVASFAIVALSPVMLITALAVRMDSKGPVIFKQNREGFNNEEVEVYKFRSLYVESQDATGVNMVRKGDDRVTKVGRFIRKTSIDELPQLFNVLQGSLSLVGPRPHVPNARTGDDLWTEVVDSYIARHKVKPGVTGWAQINGWRGEVDNREKLQGRVDADLYYIENWSLAFDLYILALTPLRLMNTENAY